MTPEKLRAICMREPCEDCGNSRWLICERDGRRVVETCDACNGNPEDLDCMSDEEAAELAQLAGIQCEPTYPCYIINLDQ